MCTLYNINSTGRMHGVERFFSIFSKCHGWQIGRFAIRCLSYHHIHATDSQMQRESVTVQCAVCHLMSRMYTPIAMQLIETR